MTARRALLIGTAAMFAACMGQLNDGDTETSFEPLTSSGVTATLSLASDWGSGYCANVTLTNGSTAQVTSWTITVQLNQSTLGSIWSATGSVTGSVLTARPVSYTTAIASGNSTSFGFCANATGTSYRPTLATLTVVGGGSGNVSGGAQSGSGGARIGSGGAQAGSGGVVAGSGGRTGSGGTGAGGSTSGSGGATGCTPPALGTPVGWAATSGTTTGGGSATPTVVTTLSALNSALAGTTARVIWVQGTIKGNVTVGSNKTVQGVCGGKLQGHIEIANASNVIFHNLFISGYSVGNCALDPSYDSSVGCSSGQDAVSVQKNSHHIWFDHCDIADGSDGNLDITNGANYVTVSWTKFHYTPRTDNSGDDSTGAAGHRYSNLVGGTDSPSSYNDAAALNVTWHHNWWADNVVERQARVRFGKNHFFNNLWSSATSNYCIRAGKQAKLLIQNNVFSGVRDPHEFNSTTDQGTAYITSSGNLYPNSSGTKATGGGGTPFTSPPYIYTLDAASAVQSAVQAGVGPR